jgi:hypothetical protein
MIENKNRITEFFLSSIFSKDGKYYTKLIENERIEFKKSLQLSSGGISKSYIKTIAGFANNKGGYIIFGIDPIENEITGIKNEYKDLDNRIISSTIKDWLDGGFDYSFFTTEINNLHIGYLFISKAKQKPILIKSNYEQNGEHGIAGEIYFRYPGMTTKISAIDLRHILQEEINIGVQKILSQMNQLIQIGPEHSAILNTQTGEINTSVDSNVNLVLSSEILNELNLIEEGKLVQKDGAPAYIIKGEIFKGQVNTKYIEREIAKGIHEVDIFNCFFSLKCPNPKEFIKEIIRSNSHNYPIYFFIYKSNMSIDEAIEFISKIDEPDVKPSVKNNLLSKLEKDKLLVPQNSIKQEIIEQPEVNENELTQQLIDIEIKYNIKNNRSKIIIRSLIFNALNSKTEIPEIIRIKYLKETLDAFLHLNPKSMKENRQYYMLVLKDLLNYIKSKSSVEKYGFKRVICQFDFILYRELCIKNNTQI